MQRAMRRVFVAAALSAAPAASLEARVPAVQKVVQMLADMEAKAKKDKRAEEVSFSAFSQWCDHTKGDLAASIQRGAEDISGLSAEVGKLNSDSQTLSEDIAQLQTEVAQHDADMKAHKDQRSKDNSAYLAEHKDYSESVDALERAIAKLSQQDYDRPALLQLGTDTRLPGEAREMVSAFLGMLDAPQGQGLDYAPPEANAYEFQSGGVVEMLKKLHGQFVEKKGQVEKEEMNSKHAHEMLLQDLTGSSENAKDDIAAKTELKASKDTRSASLAKQLSSTQATKAEDEKSLSDTKVECREKQESFHEKQQLRAEELEALAKAIEVLSGEDVQANAAKYLGLSAVRSATSLVQRALRGGGAAAEGETEKGIRTRVRDFLESEGTRLHSKDLGLIAEKLQADPFVKVKKLIDSLISRLLEEANADAEHEGFCDKELGQSKITRNKLTVTTDGLTAEIEAGKAEITGLTADIAALSKEISQLASAMKEATDLRSAEKEKNAATVKDAADAQKAVEAATAVLKDFYAKASVATALVQTRTAMPTTEWGKSGGVKMGTEEWDAMAKPGAAKVDLGHKEGMQTFGETYRGQQDEAGGVLAMLEVILSDFAALRADTQSEEALSQQAYDDFMAESKKNHAVKSRQVELNGNAKIAAEGKLRDDTADLKFTQDKLLAAERYYDKLKPQCLDNGMTYEERTQARADEIRSLKEALKILEGADIA